MILKQRWLNLILVCNIEVNINPANAVISTLLYVYWGRLNVRIEDV